MKSFFEDQTQRARKRRSTSFWIGWRIRSAVVSKALTDYLAAAGKQTWSMSLAEARAGAFLPDMDAEEQKRLTPSELRIYTHAME
jgi:hypothetical protein